MHNMFQREITKSERDICVKLGANIKQAREEMGITLREAAKHLNFPVSKLSEIENGKKVPSALILSKMAYYYEVPVNFLYTGSQSDLGEELFFKFSRYAIPIRQRLNQQLSDAITSLCAVSIPAQLEVDKLVEETEKFIDQSKRLISKNYNDAWQDMKGGANFSIMLGILEKQLDIVKSALLNQKIASKQLKEEKQAEQGALF